MISNDIFTLASASTGIFSATYVSKLVDLDVDGATESGTDVGGAGAEEAQAVAQHELTALALHQLLNLPQDRPASVHIDICSVHGLSLFGDIQHSIN